MKKNKIAFLSVIAVFLVFAIVLMVLLVNNNSQEKKIENLENEKQILVSNTATFAYLNSLTVDSFEKRVNSGDSLFVYIGNSECPDCSFFSKTLEHEVKTFPLSDSLYFVDGRTLHQNENKWLAFKEKYHFDQTPAFLLFSKGKEVSVIQWDEKNGLSEEEFHSWLIENKQLIEQVSQ